MRVMCVMAAGAALLAGCAEKETTAAQEERDVERAIAEVEAAQTPPPDVVTPERITPQERVQYKLSDSGCAFAVHNPELGAEAIMQMNVGYMKFDGQLERFAPDAGTGGGPAGTSTKYDGGTHALLVKFDTAKAQTQAADVISVPTEITLQDGRKRTVYVAEGTSLCG